MPTYDYECRNCGAEVSDVFQKVTDPELTKCDHCNTDSLYKVLTGGVHSFMAGSNTVGSLADKNSKLFKSQINEMEAMKKEMNPEPEKPWHHKHGNKSIKEIAKMTPTQQKKYIMEGK